MTQNPNSFHMRRKDLEINDPAKIEKIIQEAKICHLALVDNGVPYVVPMNFGWENGSLYFHSANHGRKIDILKKNNMVSFSMVGKMEVTDKSTCKVAYQSVSGIGRAHFVTTVEEKLLGIRSVMKQILGEEFDFPLKSLDRTTVIRIEIQEIKGKQAGKF